jgi:hypothetical protein
MTREVDGGATQEQNREKGAEDRRSLVKRRQEGREGERGQGATEPKNILHPERSRANGKTYQPITLFRERRGCIRDILDGRTSSP